MATSRSKRWNGNFDSLPAEYLQAVMEKMVDYGDRVQFSLTSPGPQPSYYVVNAAGKKMAFDKNHHILRTDNEDGAAADSSQVFTLEQVRTGTMGVAIGSGTKSRARSAVRAAGVTRTTAAKQAENCATLRYEYFRTNRATLPPTISEHSNEIAELMKNGKSVEEAFAEVINKHF